MFDLPEVLLRLLVTGHLTYTTNPESNSFLDYSRGLVGF